MGTRGIGVVLALALSAAVSANVAADPLVPLEQAEMSMTVKGSIDMRPDGSVSAYTIDKAENIPPAVRQMIGAQVSQWRFEPTLVDGKPVDARTNMQLRIVARQQDASNFNVVIQSASFSGGRDDKTGQLAVLRRTSLKPLMLAMMSSGATGEVYLALKIGPDGKVLDGIAEQVNLTVRGTEKEMADARKLLGDQSLAVVRRWTFSVPTTGESAGQPYWTGILPIKFDDSVRKPSDLARWKAYFPGPCTQIPWRDADGESHDGACRVDAAPEGVMTVDGAGPKLLTPLTQG